MNDMTMDSNQNDENGYFSDEVSTFGDRVAAARRATGMDQEKLARKMGIKLKTLIAWEDDISEPRANKLQMLTGVLNVSIIWLLTGEGEGVNDPWEDDSQSDPVRVEMSEVISQLRVIRGEYSRLGERLARLEKRLSKSQQNSLDPAT